MTNGLTDERTFVNVESLSRLKKVDIAKLTLNYKTAVGQPVSAPWDLTVRLWI